MSGLGSVVIEEGGVGWDCGRHLAIFADSASASDSNSDPESDISEDGGDGEDVIIRFSGKESLAVHDCVVSASNNGEIGADIQISMSTDESEFDDVFRLNAFSAKVAMAAELGIVVLLLVTTSGKDLKECFISFGDSYVLKALKKASITRSSSSFSPD